MSQTEQDHDAADQTATEKTAPHRKTIADRTTPVDGQHPSDNWKIDNETFRRLARTGEFAETESAE